MLVSEIIVQAYYKSGIVSPDAESPQTRQIADGLTLFKEVCYEESIGSQKFPFLNNINVLSINTSAGVQDYRLSDFDIKFTRIETITLVDNTVRYELKKATTKEFYGSGRALNVTGLSSQYYLQRFGVSDWIISLYAIPNQTYQLNIKGNESILPDEISLSTDLDDEILGFYEVYLIYKLADVLCTFNKIDTPPQTYKKLKSLESQLTAQALPDLKAKGSALMRGDTMPSFAQINLGRGWSP